MDLFVNRETELELIDESFSALLDRKRLLRTPLIEVFGVGGIGKTSLLKQVEQRCNDSQMRCIWVDINQVPSNVERSIIAQTKKYAPNYADSPEQSPVSATKFLLEQGPVVMLFDSVEMANTDQLNMIEEFLRDLIDDEKLFVVLASKKALAFQQARSVARKLTRLSLKPLARENCEIYLERQETQIEPEVRNIIFEWTRGYPLGMHVMVDAVTSGLDPRTEQGQKDILSLLTEKVIYQAVLANIRPEEKTRYFAALQLFAIPRRFNLILMQDLIETFAPELKRDSSLAYFGLPKAINEATDVLNWSMLRAGFSVDEPIRNIFLLLLKVEQPERYFAIHDFLAQKNLHLATEVPGSDRVRYLREALYHIASNTHSTQLPELLARALQIIIQEPPDTFLQFYEEFSQDDELKEALSSHLTTVQSTLDARKKQHQ